MFCTVLVCSSVVLAYGELLVNKTLACNDYLVGLIILLCCIQTIQLGRQLDELLTTTTTTWSLPQFYLSKYRGASKQATAYRIDPGVECCSLVPLAALLTIATKLSASAEDQQAIVPGTADNSLLTVWCLVSFLVSLLLIHSIIYKLGHLSTPAPTHNHLSTCAPCDNLSTCAFSENHLSTPALTHSNQPITEQHSNEPVCDLRTAADGRSQAAGARQLSAYILTIAAASLLSYIIFTELDMKAIALLLTLTAVQVLVNTVLTGCLPHSFTVGESIVMAQGTSLFTLCAGKQVYEAALQKLEYHAAASTATADLWLVGGESVVESSIQTDLFVITAVLSCALVLVLLTLVPALRGTVAYYALVLCVITFFSLPLLLFFFNADLLTWLVNKISSRIRKISLFIYWLICCAIALAIVYLNAWKCMQSNNADDTVKLANNKARNHINSEAKKNSTANNRAGYQINSGAVKQGNNGVEKQITAESDKQTSCAAMKPGNGTMLHEISSRIEYQINGNTNSGLANNATDKYGRVNCEHENRDIKSCRAVYSFSSSKADIRDVFGTTSSSTQLQPDNHRYSIKTDNNSIGCSSGTIKNHASEDYIGDVSDSSASHSAHLAYHKCTSITDNSNSTKANVKEVSHSVGTTSFSTQMQPKDKNTSSIGTEVRKQFHLLAVAAATPGLLLDAELTYMALTCAVVILVMLESVRVLNIKPFGESLNLYFTIFRDEKDEGSVLLTHIYLVVGVALPLWFNASYNTTSSSGQGIPVALFSGIIAVGVGDSAASVVGSRRGRHKWKGCCKSIEGTLAAILSQILFLVLLQWLAAACHPIGETVEMLGWSKACISVVLVSLCEAYTTQIDNLVLPIFLYILLI